MANDSIDCSCNQLLNLLVLLLGWKAKGRKQISFNLACHKHQALLPLFRRGVPLFCQKVVLHKSEKTELTGR